MQRCSDWLSLPPTSDLHSPSPTLCLHPSVPITKLPKSTGYVFCCSSQVLCHHGTFHPSSTCILRKKKMKANSILAWRHTVFIFSGLGYFINSGLFNSVNPPANFMNFLFQNCMRFIKFKNKTGSPSFTLIAIIYFSKTSALS